MKVEINNATKPSKIDTEVARFGALLFLSKEDAFQNSPFTKFNGSVTLEND